jgi:predicted ArsR family transcriptional regulator
MTMDAQSPTSDQGLLDLLRKSGPLSVVELAAQTKVTATAVRQRLTRLLAQGDIERTAEKAARGRPSHRYGLTDQGRKKSGSNFADLAMVLWQEVREIKDAEVRRGLLTRLSQRLAAMYSAKVHGNNTTEKMASLAEMFADRRIPIEVNQHGELPVLTVVACPYPELAEQDRGVCSMEKQMFAELLGENVHLSQCRLDGGNCCTFEPK